MGPTWAQQLPQGGPKMAPRSHKMAKDGPRASIWPQDGPKMAQDDPKRPQDGPNNSSKTYETLRKIVGFALELNLHSKMAPTCPRCSQENPKIAQDIPKKAPRWPQDGPRWPQDGPQMARRWPQERPKRAPRWAQDGSKSHLIAILCWVIFVLLKIDHPRPPKTA